MRLFVRLFVVALAAVPLFGQEPPPAASPELTAARAEVEKAEQALAARYKELEADFDLVRSEGWANLRAPYLQALARAPAGGPDALAAEFLSAGFLSETTCRRLLAALSGVPGGTEPEAALAQALAKVFPAPSFPECWEAAFLDLPEVAALTAAAEKVQALESAAGPTAQPPVLPPPGPEEPSDRPPGMVLVAKGAFDFGPWSGWTTDLKQNKAARERLEGYFIDVREVTNEEYLKFLAALPKGNSLYGELPVGFSRGADGKLALAEGAERLPVRGVTLEMAAAYAETVGKRLPTEEEWEKAARGESGQRFPWGAEFDEGALNFLGTGLGRPAPVGSFEKDKSPYGVLDMAGNVSELTATLDGRRPFRGKPKATDSVVYRGGSYAESGDAADLGYRWVLPAAGGRSDSVGFRCALSQRAFKPPR